MSLLSLTHLRDRCTARGPREGREKKAWILLIALLGGPLLSCGKEQSAPTPPAGGSEPASAVTDPDGGAPAADGARAAPARPAGPPPIALSAGAPASEEEPAPTPDRGALEIAGVEIGPDPALAPAPQVRLVRCRRVVVGVVCDVDFVVEASGRYLTLAALDGQAAELIGAAGRRVAAAEVILDGRAVRPEGTTVRARTDEPVRVRYLFKDIPLEEASVTVEVWIAWDRRSRGFRFEEVVID